jgi:hypothetical protein
MVNLKNEKLFQIIKSKKQIVLNNSHENNHEKKFIV